ncbi:MAG TPA: hypothetical protein VGR07_09315, partial [Thermoanaerobaculia bacterium]|nr:hypothetical protein [Thermoanaerobaculia bacterium]
MLAFAISQVVYGLLGFVSILLRSRQPGLSVLPDVQRWLLPMLLYSPVYVGAGVVLARASRQDSRALALAGFFLSRAASVSLLVLREIFPMWLVVDDLNALLTETLLPFLLWRFAREFPRVLRLDRWAPLIQAAVRTSGALGLALFSANVFARLVDPKDLSELSVYTALRYCSLGLFLLCLPVPFVAWRRSRQAGDDERRRAHWFLSGLAFWLMPWGARLLTPMGEPSWFITPGE